MKKIILFLALAFMFVLPSSPLIAQTDRELLFEVVKQQGISNTKVERLSEQVIEVSKQVAVTNAEVKSLEKAIDKRFDDANKRMEILLYVMIAILSGMFGLIGFVIWDRQASVKPILQDAKDLQKEMALFKEKYSKLEERELKFEEKTDNYFKKLAQIDARFANIL